MPGLLTGLRPLLSAAALLSKAMSQDGVSKVLIDGFPREVSQLGDFEKEVCELRDGARASNLA